MPWTFGVMPVMMLAAVGLVHDDDDMDRSNCTPPAAIRSMNGDVGRE